MPARPFTYCLSAFGARGSTDSDSPIARLPRFEVTLEPGDLLYNAPWWWHGG